MQMAELDALEHLPQDPTHSVVVEAIWEALEVIKDSVVDELEYEVEALLASEHLDQID
jgi:hypothetical protein